VAPGHDCCEQMGMRPAYRGGKGVGCLAPKQVGTESLLQAVAKIETLEKQRRKITSTCSL